MRAHLEPRRGDRPAGRGVPGARAAPGQHLRLPRRRDRPAGRRADRAAAARLAAMDQSHIAWGQAVLESLTEGAGRPAARARGAGRARAAAGRVRRCDGPGHRVALADLPQRAARRPRPATRIKRGKGGYRFVKQCAAAGPPGGRGAVLVLGRSRRLQGVRGRGRVVARGLPRQVPPAALRRGRDDRPDGQDARRVPRAAVGDADGAGAPDVGRGAAHRDRGQGVRGADGHRARLRPVVARVVVDAERGRPAEADRGDQLVGRGEPDADAAHLARAGRASAATTASRSWPTTCRPTS